MNKRLDPKEFGLPARTVIEQIGDGALAIVMDRKSRIIMADGEKILEKVEKIKEVQPRVRIILKTTAPVCSKTIRFLADEDIEVKTAV